MNTRRVPGPETHDRLAEVGHRPHLARHHRGHGERRLVLQPHRPRSLHQAPQQERAPSSRAVEQRRQTVQILSAAEARRQTRLIEMNQAVLHNLDRIIDSLDDTAPAEAAG